MLKTRVIPVMLWKDGGLVKGRGFDHSRNVGAVLPAVKVYNARDVDELVLVDVAASLSNKSPRYAEIEWFARECNVPLAVGGGIRSEEHIELVLRAGADKILLNSAAYEQPELIDRAAKNFGSQCVVVSIDYRIIDGTPVCFSHAGTVNRRLSVDDWARRVEELGAGEILLTDCSRDGMMLGYDNETVARIVNLVGVPVIASGGAGRLEDFLEVLTVGRANAVAAGSVFHFTEITPREIKEHLGSAGIPVRLGLAQ
jgi:cyclase